MFHIISYGEVTMPHVVLNGSIKLKEVFHNLSPLTIRNGEVILRTMKKYIDSEEESILVEALAIEKGRKTDFLALLNLREDGLVIRIHPYSKIEKTDAVKKTLAEIAKQLLEIFTNLKVGKTNLQDFLTQ